jgi:hypothetical protein
VKIRVEEPIRRIIVPRGSDLAKLLTEAEEMPILLEKDGEFFRLERMENEPKDIFAGYDPNKAKEAIAATAGSWADLDTDKLIADIYRAREE